MADPISIENAWHIAERTMFEQMLERFGAREGKDAAATTRIPEGRINYWIFWTGGGDASHSNGQNACFGSIRSQAEFRGIFDTRKKAQLIAGKLFNFLNDTSNYNGKNNVQWFRLLDYPEVNEIDFSIPRSDDVTTMHAISASFQLVYNTNTE